MNFYKAIWIALLVVLWLAAEVFARGFRVDQVPNGSVASCNTCHVTPGGPRNDFGKTVEFRFLSEPGSAGQVMWNVLLASLDSDGDGASNGEELQDPYGLWTTGNPAPGNSSLVTAPGDAGSDPFVKLTLAFLGMTPHIGQKLFIRVIDKATGIEVGREEMGAISQSDFNVDLTVLLVNHSYWVDFFADHNGNELYDPPPTDHAWRIHFTDSTGMVVENFSHNTNFVDIGWPTGIEVNPTGQIAEGFRLEQNYPNPFNPTTTIPFELQTAATVTLDIYNLVGQKVATVLESNLASGKYEAVWDGRDDNDRALSSGIYIYRLQAGEFRQVRRMILLK